MEFNNILLSFLSLFSLLSFFIFIFVHKISKRTQTLLDQDFTKPQAFHKEAIPRSGGIAAILSMITFFFGYNFFFQNASKSVSKGCGCGCILVRVRVHFGLLCRQDG